MRLEDPAPRPAAGECASPLGPVTRDELRAAVRAVTPATQQAAADLVLGRLLGRFRLAAETARLLATDPAADPGAVFAQLAAGVEQDLHELRAAVAPEQPAAPKE